jgi:hypothetical protein
VTRLTHDEYAEEEATRIVPTDAGTLGIHTLNRAGDPHRDRRFRAPVQILTTSMANSLALEDFLHPYLGRYMGAPDWVMATAGRAYRCIPPAMRLGGAYAEFRSQVAEAGAGPMQKLEATLACALETVPAYARYRGLLRAGAIHARCWPSFRSPTSSTSSAARRSTSRASSRLRPG